MMEEKHVNPGLRITTWNVNGIRNPFGYQPWRQERTFAAMFDILQADIVVLQEAKIQRKDLQDDMVLVPGWDVYFSLPKHKKGYSGVAIYTRSSLCAPIRAEEGITGILTPPRSSTSFMDLPEDRQIGGYPTDLQLSESPLDAATLDSEGRCVILEFPAFVLIGTYCPANRDETRDEFRIGFLNAVDARIRNLVALGKRVFWTGDMNIMREEIDTANLDERLQKEEMTVEQYLSTPARRMFNQLLVGGKVFGERDKGRHKPVMWDICRSFHPLRKGMFTCWDTKTNARPGNFGARIDYVLCTEDWKDWFCESDIQEGLMGSDHCPVYAVLKQKIEIDGKEVDIRDIMSKGMFEGGIRKRDWNVKDLLPGSAKLIPEFDRRRNIRDMFSQKPKPKPPLQQEESTIVDALEGDQDVFLDTEENSPAVEQICIRAIEEPPSQEGTATSLPRKPETADIPIPDLNTTSLPSPSKPAVKRSANTNTVDRPQKRGKSVSAKAAIGTKGPAGKGQSSLMGFFKPKVSQTDEPAESTIKSYLDAESDAASNSISMPASKPSSPTRKSLEAVSDTVNKISSQPFSPDDQESVIDPIVAKESWSRLLGKRVVPRCEHDLPCITMKTKKPGVNCGRSFYMCSRPLGPSGKKEKGSEWRCGTFIWSSDWTTDDT